MQKHLILKLSLVLISIITLFIACSSKNGKEDCKDVRNGEFVYRPSGLEGKFSYSISRNDSIQMEIEKPTGYFSKYKIKWVGNCKYEALLLESNVPFPDSIQNIRKTKPFKVEITKITKDFYIFNGQREGAPIMLTDTIWYEK